MICKHLILTKLNPQTHSDAQSTHSPPQEYATICTAYVNNTCEHTHTKTYNMCNTIIVLHRERHRGSLVQLCYRGHLPIPAKLCTRWPVTRDTQIRSVPRNSPGSLRMQLCQQGPCVTLRSLSNHISSAIANRITDSVSSTSKACLRRR